ncbi:hypothetical protein M3197_01740 [Sporosarcina aquimarina]|uniref:hypothetical protein n=1 Tax=Sporosarcina aquimarina TaxID=114975 RepID=UPI0020403170|nr:hypothetical protein [Sporosarcina aquimarina]MCM3756198.1 hypothetical protein [Sporosarcina aquimarina]
MKRWIIALLGSYWVAIGLNFMTSRKYLEMELTLMQAVPSLLFVAVLLLVASRSRLSNKALKWSFCIGVIATVMYLGSNYFYPIFMESSILTALFQFQIPLYYLFVTPVDGLNFFLHVRADFFPIVPIVIYSLAFILIKFKKTKSNIYDIDNKLFVKLVIFSVLFVFLGFTIVYGYMFLYLNSLAQFIPVLIAVVVFLYSGFVLYYFHLLNTKHRVRIFMMFLICVLIGVSIWPIQAAYSEREVHVNSQFDVGPY